MFEQGPIRLNKYISESGICSRREADRFIESGVVFVNGVRAGVGTQVRPGDRVRVNGRDIQPREASSIVLIALNKPVGIVSTTEEGERDNIVRFVNHPSRLFPIGRLDKDSQGLIFLTNDGDIVNRILRAGNEHEKEYLVTVDREITPEFVARMAGGIPILGTVTRRCVVERVSPFVFRIVLVQGLNRQIRRMCEYLGYNVTKLVRTRIMHISLGGLAEGDWRDLTPAELAELARLIKDSSGEAEPASSKAGANKGSGAKPAPKPPPKPGPKGASADRRAGGARDPGPTKGGGSGKNAGSGRDTGGSSGRGGGGRNAGGSTGKGGGSGRSPGGGAPKGGRPRR